MLKIETDDHSLACFLSCAVQAYGTKMVDDCQAFINAAARKMTGAGASAAEVNAEVARLCKVRDEYYRCQWQAKKALDEIIRRQEEEARDQSEQ